MGEAKRKNQVSPGSKYARAFHLMKLISRYNDYEIRKFLERRKYPK
jgi:hypothetical protein